MPASPRDDTDHPVPPAGRIAFVGAGPGAHDLLTLRAVECLRRADVVVHDALVPAGLLDAVGTRAERIAAPRGDDVEPGAAIGRLLVAQAAAGRFVVRLKGGDPTVFARLAEELEPVRQAGIPVEFVPGVTAALAAASAAGVPLTNRSGASSLTIVTGRGADDREEACDFARLAALPGTIVVYMGVEQAPQWARALVAAGRPADTPVAVVSRCSWPDERVASSTLGGLAADVAVHGWRSPAALIVGAAARPACGPLAGRTVLVTRPEGQGGDLAALVRAAGGASLHVPLVHIGPPVSWGPLDEALARADGFDWIVFASANGARACAARLRAAGRDARAFGTARLAAIGPATRRELEACGLAVDLEPDTFSSEGLVAALAGMPAGGRFLLVRADRGRDVLRRELEARGHHVDEVAAYSSRAVESLPPETVAEMDRAGIDWITLTSPAIATAAVRLFGTRLGRWRIASISPITSAALEATGFRPDTEAARATAASLVDAIAAHEAGRSAGDAPPAESAQSAG
ncbi:MAG: uroporphyrinogen-III C-methyltransferase [Planctomycetaceae bacterium]